MPDRMDDSHAVSVRKHMRQTHPTQRFHFF
jgi:hypothetical protein